MVEETLQKYIILNNKFLNFKKRKPKKNKGKKQEKLKKMINSEENKGQILQTE